MKMTPPTRTIPGPRRALTREQSERLALHAQRTRRRQFVRRSEKKRWFFPRSTHRPLSYIWSTVASPGLLAANRKAAGFGSRRPRWR